MPRRNRIPFEHRERLVRAFEDVNEDYLIVADTLGINRSTARSIVSRYVREGRIAERPRGGPNHVRVDNEMRDCLNEILNENCLLTLTQLNQELRQRLPRKPRICDCTVARTLEGMLFRVKLARPVPADRNRPDVIQKRPCYSQPQHRTKKVTTLQSILEHCRTSNKFLESGHQSRHQPS